MPPDAIHQRRVRPGSPPGTERDAVCYRHDLRSDPRAVNLAVDILRWIHIPFGLLGLAVFWIPLILKKGSRWHRRVGWIFVVCMAVASVGAAAICLVRFAQAVGREGVTLAALGMPLFLFNVSLLTLVSVHSGIATLREKKRVGPSHNRPAVALAASLLACSIGTLVVAAITRNPILFTLPVVGLFVSGQWLSALRRPPTDRMHWWYQHMAGMLGGCIAAITAALITNARHITPIVPVPMWTLWIAPSALGVPLMFIWIARYRRTFAGTSKPDATKPDATKPDATKPDATKPDATKPDATDSAAT
jgi:uncharacterized membrane protein